MGRISWSVQFHQLTAFLCMSKHCRQLWRCWWLRVFLLTVSLEYFNISGFFKSDVRDFFNVIYQA